MIHGKRHAVGQGKTVEVAENGNLGMPTSFARSRQRFHMC